MNEDEDLERSESTGDEALYQEELKKEAEDEDGTYSVLFNNPKNRFYIRNSFFAIAIQEIV